MRRRIERLEQKLAKLEGPRPLRMRLLVASEDGAFDLESGEPVSSEPGGVRRIVLDWDDGEEH